MPQYAIFTAHRLTWRSMAYLGPFSVRCLTTVTVADGVSIFGAQMIASSDATAHAFRTRIDRVPASRSFPARSHPVPPSGQMK